MCRKNNSKKTRFYFISKLFIPNEEYNVTYETERANFIGRNNNVDAPDALTKENLSNTIGSNIDPVMSLRSNITIEPGKKKTIYLAESKKGKKNSLKEKKFNPTKTGFDVTKAIEINKTTAEEEVAPEKIRRAAPIAATESDAPVRRAAAPKYKITSIVE